MTGPEASGGFLSAFRPKFQELHALEREEDRLKARLTQISQDKEALVETLSAAMDDAMVSRVTIDDITYFRRNDRYPRIADQDAAFTWLNEIGRGDMIKPTVNAMSLRSLVIERGKQNEEVPECIEVITKKRVQTRG